MKLLVMSDSHRNIGHMLLAVEQTNPDAILHLGDHIGDAMKLNQRLPNATVYMVKGNCDPSAAGKDTILLPIEGVKILMTHGHIFGVKTGLAALVERAAQQEADLALFGHTHRGLIQNTHGLTLMNPGQMERHDNNRTASYGIVTVADGKFDCEIGYL